MTRQEAEDLKNKTTKVCCLSRDFRLGNFGWENFVRYNDDGNSDDDYDDDGDDESFFYSSYSAWSNSSSRWKL